MEYHANPQMKYLPTAGAKRTVRVGKYQGDERIRVVTWLGCNQSEDGGFKARGGYGRKKRTEPGNHSV